MGGGLISHVTLYWTDQCWVGCWNHDTLQGHLGYHLGILLRGIKRSKQDKQCLEGLFWNFFTDCIEGSWHTCRLLNKPQFILQTITTWNMFGNFKLFSLHPGFGNTGSSREVFQKVFIYLAWCHQQVTFRVSEQRSSGSSGSLMTQHTSLPAFVQCAGTKYGHATFTCTLPLYLFPGSYHLKGKQFSLNVCAVMRRKWVNAAVEQLFCLIGGLGSLIALLDPEWTTCH